MNATTRSTEERNAPRSAGSGTRLCLAGIRLLAMLGAGAPASFAQGTAGGAVPLLAAPPSGGAASAGASGAGMVGSSGSGTAPLPVEPAKTGTPSVTLLPPAPEAERAAVAAMPAPTPRQQADRARRAAERALHRAEEAVARELR